MKLNKILFAVLIALIALAAFGCDQDDDDDDDDNDDSDDDDDNDNDTSADDDDDDTPPDFSIDLDFELLGFSTLKVWQQGEKLIATFVVYSDYDIIARDVELSGTGTTYYFDGNMKMYAFKFQGEALPGSPCGSDKISYSLTLTAKHDNQYFGGGFVAYCGENTYTGRSARVYRLSGRM